MYGIGLNCSTEDARMWWSFPRNIGDICNLFVRYVLGDLKCLPWSDSPISAEVLSIRESLVDLNRRGFLTVNSQPAVNGEKSSHPVYGWGPKNGYVYQKAYLECFCHPKILDQLLGKIEKDPNMTFHAVNKHGDLRTNTYSDGPNAVTWGVYPGKEIIQPTIVETVSFLAWKVCCPNSFLTTSRMRHIDWDTTGPSVIPMILPLESLSKRSWILTISSMSSTSIFLSWDALTSSDFHQNDAIFEAFDSLINPDLPLLEDSEQPKLNGTSH